ncbi:MAG: hypothetical protein ACOYEQ_06220 [Bacillota bacterium]
MQHLLALTAHARRLARAGDYKSLERLIRQREEVLAQLGSRGCRPSNDVQAKLIKEIVLCIEQLDKEIVYFVRDQMKQHSRDMLEITTKLRVLSAYSKGLSGNRRFDRVL